MWVKTCEICVLRAFMLARLTAILCAPDRVDLDTVDALGEAELIVEASLRDELDAMRRRRIGIKA